MWQFFLTSWLGTHFSTNDDVAVKCSHIEAEIHVSSVWKYCFNLAYTAQSRGSPLILTGDYTGVYAETSLSILADYHRIIPSNVRRKFTEPNMRRFTSAIKERRFCSLGNSPMNGKITFERKFCFSIRTEQPRNRTDEDLITGFTPSVPPWRSNFRPI